MESLLMKTFDFCYHLIKVYFIVIPHLLGIFFTSVILDCLTSTQFSKIRGENPPWHCKRSNPL